MADLIANLFTLGGFVQLIEYLIILGELVYVIFAFLVTREVSLMNASFKTSAASLFTLVAYAHFIASLVILLISITSVI